MANLMDRGQASLVNWLKASGGRAVAYSRGTTSVALTVWVGSTKFAMAPRNPGGATVSWSDRDYLVAVADFQAALTAAGLTGPASLPQKGDRITDADSNGAAIVFELATPTGEPVWRYSDQTRQALRLHTKRVS